MPPKARVPKQGHKGNPRLKEEHEGNAQVTSIVDEALQTTDAVAAALMEGDAHVFALFCTSLSNTDASNANVNNDEIPFGEGVVDEEAASSGIEDTPIASVAKKSKQKAGPHRQTLVAIPKAGEMLQLADPALSHRITHVLRCRPGMPVIFFDDEIAVTCALHESTFSPSTEGVVSGIVRQVTLNQPHIPTMHLYQGLLRKETFETVCYYAAQMGVSTVQPLITHKTQRVWGGKAERARLAKIMVAACEQSKSFIRPTLKTPAALEDALTKPPKLPRLPKQQPGAAETACTSDEQPSASDGTAPAPPPPPRQHIVASLFFEADGRPLLSVIEQLRAAHVTHINLMLGPEGGLTQAEKELLSARGWVQTALTPTILRAQEAVCVAVGALRCVLR